LRIGFGGRRVERPGWLTSSLSLPRRDRIAILAALAGVTALAWLYLIVLSVRMPEMGCSDPSAMLRIRPWTGLDFLLMFVMWAVMMVGMMLPSATPTALVYAAVVRKAARQGTPLAPTIVFVAGYLMIWCLFSAGATLAQWALDRAALLSPMMVASSPALGAALLIGAGVYQLTPVKDRCLRHCRSPVFFIAERWRPGAWGALRMGAEHGAFCLGCCWVLMGLLFFGGVMNLLWIAAITIFVLAEKALPSGAGAGRLAGVAMILAGVAILVRILLPHSTLQG
jgi:predicted metal-binding membrane protein